MRAHLFNINAFYKYKNVIDKKNSRGMWWNFIMFESIVIVAELAGIITGAEAFSPVFLIYALIVLAIMAIRCIFRQKIKKAEDWSIILSYVVGFVFAVHMEAMYPNSHIVLLNFAFFAIDLAVTFILSPYFVILGQLEGGAAFVICYLLTAEKADMVIVGYIVLITAFAIVAGLLSWDLRLSNIIFENELAYLATGTDDVFLANRNNDLWADADYGIFAENKGKNRYFTFIFNMTENRLSSVREGNIFDLQGEMSWEEVSNRILRYVGNPSDYRNVSEFLSATGEKNELKEEKKSTVAGFNMPGGDRMWLNLEMTVRPHPVNGSVMRIVSMEDITGDKVFKGIMNLILTENYDVIICIEKAKKRGIMIHSDEKGDINVSKCEDYEEMMVNYATERVADYDREGTIKAGHLKNLYEHLQDNSSFEIFVDECNADNEIRKKRFVASYLDDGKRFLTIFMQDVTELIKREKSAKDKLEKALKEAKAANDVKTEFLSRMSHEMRTPMNAIVGLASLVEDANGNSELLKDYVSKIKSSSDYLLQLINDVLDMSGISDGKINMTKAPVKFADFTETINTIIAPLCQNKNIAYFPDSEIPGSTVLIMDKLRVSQVFTNLLSNAVKYTSEGGIIEFSSYCVGVDGNKGTYRFVVKDNGIGMTEEFTQHMFEPFAQEKETNRASLNGTGIGLSIAKGIVDMLGGKISATSKPDVGTTFVVDLVFEIANREEPHKEEAISLECLKNKRILVVEDNEINREIAVALLTGQEMIAEEAENGLEAVEAFDKSVERYYDAILMDIRMPKMNGLEATRNIRYLGRKDAQTVPIIAMTANAFSEDVELSVNSGMNAHLSKPINPQILYETLAKFISERG